MNALGRPALDGHLDGHLDGVWTGKKITDGYPLFFLESAFFGRTIVALPNTFLGTPLVLDIEERRAIVRWKATTTAVVTVPGIGRADG
jgi:hypothetical protein